MASQSERSHSIEESQKVNYNDPVSKDKYNIIKIIKEGDFVTLNLCKDKKGVEKVIKFTTDESYKTEVEINEVHLKTIKRHFKFTVDVKSFNRFNNILEHGRMEGIKQPFIVYEKLGKNLNDIREDYDMKQIQPFEGLHILMDCISIINYLHNLGYVHRNIKPSSFCYRSCPKKKNSPIVLTNFEGCCKIINDKVNTKNTPERMTKFSPKNIKYCSINQHKTNQIYTPTDDIESWYYVGVFLFEGDLPWKDMKPEKDKEIMEAKKSLKGITENPFYVKTPDVFRHFITNISNKIDVDEITNSMMKIITKYNECIITDNLILKKEKEEKEKEKEKEKKVKE